MKNEFIPYEQALALKELGFDEPCFGRFNPDNDLVISHTETYNTDFRKTLFTQAPTFSQAFRFFREKHDCHHTIHRNKKYVGIAYSSVVNFNIDEFNTYEEAELACLKQLIEIANEQQ